MVEVKECLMILRLASKDPVLPTLIYTPKYRQRIVLTFEAIQYLYLPSYVLPRLLGNTKLYNAFQLNLIDYLFGLILFSDIGHLYVTL